jgi:TfoX/Sxy family transcriptional regulator of competence genes
MSTSQRTIDFLLEQLAGAGDVSARAMFGEFGLYCDGKIVGLICNDQLYVKPTKAGRAFIGDVAEAPPYRGAKPSLLIDGDQCEDGEWLSELIRLSAAELPLPKPKKPKR